MFSFIYTTYIIESRKQIYKKEEQEKIIKLMKDIGVA